jgi:choline dehydrogenase-like flavoprotein
MIRPADTTDQQTLQADVCIVGAGAAGLTLACELESTSISVMVLEAGGDGPRASDSQDPYEGATQPPHARLSSYRRRVFGGTTTLWGGRCVPFDPIDFERREYVPDSGWPIGYQEIAQHYPQAMDYCDAGRFDFSARSSLERTSALLPGLAPDSADLCTDAIERYSLPTDFGRKFRPRLQRSDNVTVLTHATVLRLLKRAGTDRIGAAECLTRQGRRVQIRANVFVVAAGGIESPRLLLVSDPAGSGLGNRYDCVGRYYMCHIESTVGAVRARRGPVPFAFQKTRDGVYSRRKFLLSEAAQRRARLLNIAFRLHYPDISEPAHRNPILSALYLARRTLQPEYRELLNYRPSGADTLRVHARHIRNIVAGLPQLTAFGIGYLVRRQLARRKLPYILVPNGDGTFPLEFNSEQTPLANSRLRLMDERDMHGTSRIQVDWRTCRADIDSICAAYRILKRSIDRSGSCCLELDDGMLLDEITRARPVGGHHIGTTRMSSHPTRGVVDANCAVHGIPNLYIASAAVFPTASHANPTLTIVALSLRLAAHLKSSLAGPR